MANTSAVNAEQLYIAVISDAGDHCIETYQVKPATFKMIESMKTRTVRNLIGSLWMNSFVELGLISAVGFKTVEVLKMFRCWFLKLSAKFLFICTESR